MRNRKLLLFSLIIGSILIAIPLLVFASHDADRGHLIYCATKWNFTGPPPAGQAPSTAFCTICDLLVLLQTGFNFIWLVLTVPIATVMLLYGGFLMVLPSFTGSSTQATKGRAVLLHTVMGLAIVFFAWIGVDSILKIMGAQQTGNFMPWNRITCTAPTVPVPLPGTISGGGGSAGGGSGGGGGGGGAACSQVTAGPCSVNSLQGTFGAAATAASTICRAESAGIPDSESRIDILPNSGNRPFSAGLFQINLTANTISCSGQTLNCPSAFTGRNRNATIINESLYAQCLTATKNAFCNTQKAKALYDSRGGRWNDWLNTAQNCNLL